MEKRNAHRTSINYFIDYPPFIVSLERGRRGYPWDPNPGEFERRLRYRGGILDALARTS